MALSLLKKIIRSLIVLVIVSFVTFCMMFGDGRGIARGVLGLNATEESVTAKVHELGLDRPLLVQFGDWLGHVVTGDLGTSFFTGQGVNDALATRVPVTLTLIVVTLLLTAVLSVLLGVAAAVKGGWIDRVVQFFSVLGTAIPGFVVAIVLVFLLAIQWRAFPATGYVPPAQGAGPWIASVTLPVIALLIGSVANSASQFRSAVRETLSRDFVRTLRARGVGERQVLFRHVLRNAAGPGMTVLSLQTLGMLGGAVFIEQVFALPGMGQLANESAQLGDVPIVMGTVLVTIVIVLVVNLLGDLAIAALNPKARS
ncbi:ABC transporter permease [Kineococcus sp. SYSU DK003]|uniref:ABC transporter permease n=1 Tax=Kineococcus sp. SYSU DK003 TaxID=3383124 RepID=UPI003D7CB25C